jgi:hypothetical protein
MPTALEHIRPMRGGSQAHLMLANDGYYYVVKFENTPQGRRILANEWLAGRLAQTLGLPVPPMAMLDVPPKLIAASPGLAFRIGAKLVPCAPGIQFGSRLPAKDPHTPIYDWLPEPALATVSNTRAFAGILAFDKWTCNCDGRQLIFCRAEPGRSLKAYMVDHGFCFNAGEWNFPDSPLRGVYSRNLVYANVTGWHSFDPWLTRLEELSESALFAIGDELPLEWYGDRLALDRLLAALCIRRRKVRELVWAVKRSPRAPFANWGATHPGLTAVA